VPVVKDHVHAGRILRQIIHSEKLHYGRTFAAPAARIELADAHELRRSPPHTGLPNCASNHRWKPVEVTHRKLLPHNEEGWLGSNAQQIALSSAIRGLFGIRKLAKMGIAVNGIPSFFCACERALRSFDSYPGAAVTASPSRIGCVDD
jgi:hypothetical protein